MRISSCIRQNLHCNFSPLPPFLLCIEHAVQKQLARSQTRFFGSLSSRKEGDNLVCSSSSSSSLQKSFPLLPPNACHCLPSPPPHFSSSAYWVVYPFCITQVEIERTAREHSSRYALPLNLGGACGSPFHLPSSSSSSEIFPPTPLSPLFSSILSPFLSARPAFTYPLPSGSLYSALLEGEHKSDGANAKEAELFPRYLFSSEFSSPPPQPVDIICCFSRDPCVVEEARKLVDPPDWLRRRKKMYLRWRPRRSYKKRCMGLPSTKSRRRYAAKRR